MENNTEIDAQGNPYSSFRQPSGDIKPKKSRLVYIIGIANVFLIIIIVSGIFFFNKSQSNSGSQKPKNTAVGSEEAKNAGNQAAEAQNFQMNESGDGDLQSKTTPEDGKPPWFGNLSSLEQSFFNTPKSDATSEERSTFANLLRQNAKSSDQLILREGCKPDNLVYSVSALLEVSIKNEDSSSHIVKMGSLGNFSIPAGSASKVKIEQDRKGRVLGYACDEMLLVGFLAVPS